MGPKSKHPGKHVALGIDVILLWARMMVCRQLFSQKIYLICSSTMAKSTKIVSPLPASSTSMSSQRRAVPARNVGGKDVDSQHSHPSMFTLAVQARLRFAMSIPTPRLLISTLVNTQNQNQILMMTHSRLQTCSRSCTTSTLRSATFSTRWPSRPKGSAMRPVFPLRQCLLQGNNWHGRWHNRAFHQTGSEDGKCSEEAEREEASEGYCG